MKINLLSGAVATAYLIMCSCLYLWVFWLYFDINILQFIDSSDIIKAAALPAIPLVCVLVFTIAIEQFNIIDSQTRIEYKKAGGGYKAISYAAFTYMLFILLVAAFSFGSAIYVLVVGTSPERYSSAALLIGGGAAFYLMFKVKLFETWGKARFILIAALCYFPANFMHKGMEDAKNIIAGKNTYLVSSNLSCSKDEHEKYRYIATLSDKVFSINLSDNSICIQKYEFLSLAHEKDAKPLIGVVVM